MWKLSIYKKFSNGFSFFQGNYDLSQILDVEQKKNFQLVLCYRLQSQANFSEPICDIQLLKAEKNDKKRKTALSSDFKLIIPKDYAVLEFGFGKEDKNRFIVFKKSKETNYPLKL